jgi:prepilin-type processing-associated H-X9-DG protein
MTRTSFRRMLICIALMCPLALLAGEQPLPGDLRIVPPDALGFLHVRVADVWKSEHFKDWRETVSKAGEKALAAFDARFFPAPSSIDRVTIFATRPKEGQEPRSEHTFVIIATSKPVDKEGFLQNTVPGAKEEKTAAGTFLVDEKNKAEIHFLDDRTFVLGAPGEVRGLMARRHAAGGNLSAALRLARSGKALVAAVSPRALPQEVLAKVPPPLQALIKAKLALVTLDLKHDGEINLRLAYSNAEDAGEAEAAAKQGLELARAALANPRMEMEKKVFGDGKPGTLQELPEAAAALFGLGLLNRVDEFLASAPLHKKDNSLALSLKLPKGGAPAASLMAVSAGLLVPAVQKVREAAARTQSANNLKQIALAMLNYESAYRKFPAAAISDANGKPLLSWRVTILPFIEQQPLYQQFKLDEPWDSEHNRKLIPQMPPTYALPAASAQKPGETYYRVVVGGGAGLELKNGIRIADITDGTSNTILAFEAAESVPWTKPDELVYDAKKPLPKFGNFYGNGRFNAVFFDGHVSYLRNDLPEATLRALLTRAGGEVVPLQDD